MTRARQSPDRRQRQEQPPESRHGADPPARSPPRERQPSDDGEQEAGGGGRPQPWWQWLIAGVGSLLLLGTVGELVYQSAVATGGPPVVSLAVMRVEPTPEGRYVMIVQAENHGGSTAAELKIEGELRQHGGASIEKGEFTLDYLPAGSTREGGLFFTHDPRSPDVELTLRPSGYHKP